MGDHDARRLHAVKALGDDGLRAIIEGAGGLVEDDDGWMRRQRPRDQDALLLPAGDVRTAFADHGLKPHRHLADVLGDARGLRRRPGVVLRQGGDAYDVGEDVAGHELPVLQHDAHLGAHGDEGQAGKVLPIIIDRAALRRLEAQHQAKERALAAAGAPHDGDVLSGGDGKAHVVQHVLSALRIGKGEVPDLDGSGQKLRVHPILGDFRHGVQNELEVFKLRAERHDLLRGGEHGVQARVEGRVGGVESKELGGVDHVRRRRLPRHVDVFEDEEIERQRQEHGLHRHEDFHVVRLPAFLVVPLVLLAEGFAPKVIGLLLHALHPELGKPRENLLDDARGGVLGRGHVPLRLDVPPQNPAHEKPVEKPKQDGDCRQLQAVVCHEDEAPKGKHGVQDLPGKLPRDHGPHSGHAHQAAREVAGLDVAEKLRRQREKPPPDRGLRRHVEMGRESEDRDGAHDGHGHRRQPGDDGHLRDGGKPLPVEDGDDVPEDGFRDDGRHERNESRDDAGQEDRLPVAVPCLPDHASKQAGKRQLLGRKPRVAGESVPVYFFRHVLRDGDAFGMLHRDEGIGRRRGGDERRQLPLAVLRARGIVIAEHDAAVLFLPSGGEGHEAHLHVAFLHEALHDAELVDFLHQLRRDGNIFRGQGEGLGDAPHDEDGLAQFFLGAAARVLGAGLVLLVQEMGDGLLHQPSRLAAADGEALPEAAVLAAEPRTQQHGEDALVLGKFLHQRAFVVLRAGENLAVLPKQKHLVAPVGDEPKPRHGNEPAEPSAHEGQKLRRRHGVEGDFLDLGVLGDIEQRVDFPELVHSGKRAFPRRQLHQIHTAEGTLVLRDGVDLRRAGNKAEKCIFVV